MSTHTHDHVFWPIIIVISIIVIIENVVETGIYVTGRVNIAALVFSLCSLSLVTS